MVEIPVADLSTRFDLSPTLIERMRAELTVLADEAVQAIIVEVPAYAELSAPSTGLLRKAVSLALGAFLTLAAEQSDASLPIVPSTSGAYDLGQGEARSGRSLDALLAAYRIGARVSWRRLSRTAAQEGMPAGAVGAFAELVFAYIDALSAASVAGHSDEIAKTGRARERYLEQLVRLLLDGADESDLDLAAERAAWTPPTTLTAALLPPGSAPHLRHLPGPSTLTVSGDVAGLGEQTSVLLVPDLRTSDRARARKALTGMGACLGPARPWRQVRSSMQRAVRGAALRRSPQEFIDTDERLADLVLTADPEAHADLRRRALAPLDDVRESTRTVLIATLRSWLLHQGRRADVADDLHVHPQTVRYRMGLIRDRFGDALDDPAVVLALVLALGIGETPDVRER